MTSLVVPGSLAEARELLAAPGSRPIAGGVGVMLRMRLAEPPAVPGATPLVEVPRADRYVAVGGLPELTAIEAVGDGGLRIGAAVTLARVARDPLVLARAPLLAFAGSLVGSEQIRAVATIGGNLADGDPASDPMTALLALGGTTDEAGGLIEAILVPSAAVAWGYRKGSARSLADRAAATAAVVLVVVDGVVASVRAVVGAAAAVPFRVPAFEDALTRRGAAELAVVPEAELAAVAREALADTPLLSDVRASDWYRRELAAVLLARAARDAARRGAPA